MADRNHDRDTGYDEHDSDRDDYYTNNMYYGRNYDYNRNEFDVDYGSYYSERPAYGRYAGYGPSGYRRSDERIEEDVNDRLTWNGRLDATGIHVEAKDGIVTLTGEVDSRRDKRLAEDIADSISGVQDVNNELRLRNRANYRGWQGTASRSEVHLGMQVVDSQGEHVGEVREVRLEDFRVDRPSGPDLYAPFSMCQVSGGQVRLNVNADRVDDQGWIVAEEARGGASHGRG